MLEGQFHETSNFLQKKNATEALSYMKFEIVIAKNEYAAVKI